MNTGDLIERNIKGKLLLFLSPLVLLTSMVWFTSDFTAQKLAYLFQIYLSLTLCFISGFLWSQSGLFKAANLRYLGSIILLVTLSSGFLSILLIPVYGLIMILILLLGIRFLQLPDRIKTIFPLWFLQLVNKINVMICICILLMLAYWLNPYSNPLSYF
ncbi:uncharacterized protein METZ01_LOCUS117111 [marine metagenome]|uniref:DUF3429 domain-containing protein n=1 Tax=marine metagenome TaxID=408172 RepID=A0A381XJA4_9ZZZZ|tara:strand:- start:1656 stop:2132 length:477 start_codon:yes stop_codon:yes gene_type:complete